MTFNPLSIFTDPQMRTLCAELTALGYEKATQQVTKLNLPADTRASLLTQVQLRHQATEKLGSQALQLFLTRDGLEQATRQIVAQLHATRFQNLGATHIADLGCGNGLDALAFTEAGMRVQAWDLDEIAYTAASLNLPAGNQVHLGNVMDIEIADLTADGVDAIFADPARRTGANKGNQRVTSPQEWSPPLPHVLNWRPQLHHLVGTARLGVKLAPGINYEFLPTDMQAQWISIGGSLVEASLWTTAETTNSTQPIHAEPGRLATIFPRGQQTPIEFFHPGSPGIPPTAISEGGQLKTYLWEADPAVIRAGILHQLAEAGNAEIISAGIAYLTSNTPPPAQWQPAVSVFEIITTTKLKPKAVATALKSMRATNVEVKKRGAEISPDQWQRDLLKTLKLKKTNSENPLVVFATRVKGEHAAIIARRV